MVVVGGQSNVNATNEKQKNSSVKRTEKGGKRRKKKRERLKGEIEVGDLSLLLLLLLFYIVNKSFCLVRFLVLYYRRFVLTVWVWCRVTRV